MEARRQVGIEGGFLMALGRWQGKQRKGQMVRMIETLSALCIAPPGTGKTAAIIIPSIVTATDTTCIINDPKPELFDATGAWRSTVSDVFMLDWSKVDIIDEHNPANCVFYPRFNFLSPKLVPGPGPNRDTYIDAIAQVLIPEPKAGGDTYFVNKGRASLTGFLHYIITKIENANYDGIPERWRGKEASIPMLSDWIAYNQLEQTEASFDPNSMMPSGGGDKLGEWIRGLTNDVKPGSGNFPSPRAFVELSSLVNMADKERSGVLGTMDQALLPFKNEAVMQRTEATDFTPDDMRGVLDPAIVARTKLDPADPNYLDPSRKLVRRPDGSMDFEWASQTYRKLFYDKNNWRPLTLYVRVNQADAAAFATITALLYEVLAKSLISFGPFEYNEKTDRILGPFAVLFVLDEFAKLPKTPAVMSGPDLGRSKKVSFEFAFQDYGQLEINYGKADISIVNSTASVKIVLQQNNPDTINTLISMVGKTTISRTSKSTQEGISKQANPFAWSQSDNLEEVNFLRHEDVAALRPDECLVFVQGFLNRPMKLKAPFFFNDPELLPRVRSRGKGPVATDIIPQALHHERLGEIDRLNDSIRAEALEALERDNALHNPDPPETALELFENG